MASRWRLEKYAVEDSEGRGVQGQAPGTRLLGRATPLTESHLPPHRPSPSSDADETLRPASDVLTNRIAQESSGAWAWAWAWAQG